MRRSIQTVLMGCAFIASAALPAAAGNYPFCIKGCDFGSGLGDCSFSSYEQCQASASGRVASCERNPSFSARAELQPGRANRFQRKN